MIPSKADRAQKIPYDRELYKARSEVECTFNLLKQARRFATRYEKRHAFPRRMLRHCRGFADSFLRGSAPPPCDAPRAPATTMSPRIPLECSCASVTSDAGGPHGLDEGGTSMTTRVMFTGKADHRFAWIGNDAEDRVDILQELLTQIDLATTSIEVSSMSFSFTDSGTSADGKVKAIAEKLAQKAAAGVAVRILGNAGHRFQTGYLTAQRGPVVLADENVPALVARVSFQSATAAVPAGFAVDTGGVFGPHGAISYGWDTDVTAAVGPHGAVPAAFTNPLLSECYAAVNSGGPRTWTIQLDPSEYYYVRVVCGEAAFGTRNVVRVQGQTVFSKPVGGTTTFFEYLSADPGEFVVSTVEGGDNGGVPASRRVQAGADGKLAVQIGKASESGWSSLDYIEIYRASAANPAGDDGTDAHRVQRRGIHHAKFFLLDGAKLWCGSHNITPVDPADAAPRSEDAIFTDDPNVVAAFRAEFNRWWGATSGAPDPAVARTLVFKTPTPTDVLVPGVLLPGSYPWKLRFSPSTTVAPGIDLFDVVDDHLSSATRDVLLMVEQVTEGGDFGTFDGPNDVISRLKSLGAAGVRVHGVLGNEVYPSSLTGPGIDVIRADEVHDKALLVDTLRDNETLRAGKVLCGSMNISQGAMHTNDEQTLVIADPAIANQYLQLAAGIFALHDNPLERAADVVIVLDRSGSMNDPLPDGFSKMKAARAAAKAFLAVMDLDGGHRVGIVPFGASVDTAAERAIGPLDASTVGAFAPAIDAVDATGTIASATCYGLALTEAWEQLTSVTSPATRRLVVFLSDGKQNRAPWAIDRYPTLVANSVEIHTTSFGDLSTDPSGANAILHEMAAASGASFAQVDNDDMHLRKRFADVARDAQDLTTILDPSWVVAPGQELKQSFPVDLESGRLVVAWFWSASGGGLTRAFLRTPGGTTLTRTSAGVNVRRGDGHEVWHIDLGQVRRSGEVLGEWVASAQADHRERARFRLDLCVYATDSGLVKLQVEVAALANAARELRLRVWDGRELAKGARVSVSYAPPGQDPLLKRMTPVAVTDVAANRRAWRGVQGARFSAAPGPHTLHLVVEGVAHTRGKDGNPRAVPFRRERTLQWHISAPLRPLPVLDLARLRKRRIR